MSNLSGTESASGEDSSGVRPASGEGESGEDGSGGESSSGPGRFFFHFLLTAFNYYFLSLWWCRFCEWILQLSIHAKSAQRTNFLQ